ncbi:Cbp1 family collagen-binding glycoprotein adhesin [Natronoflexus pectinivorans]|uniref:Uncharacterized protein n=1 Tax=Natronoflexus pectinivorans TaxID=682526 RepID=A0A4R2GH18_9BACT|nr:hypothetical protein [Natronoflexus pectinivorans]TCO07669.1 hypothetical protein EV194_10753 [Natronoflexus pectinivorans]
MRNLILLMLVPFLWQCTSGPSRTELMQMNDSLLVETAKKEIQLNQLVETLGDIDENLRLIKEKEQIISVQAESGDMRGRTGEQINEDIQLIYELMVQNKDRIQELEAQLRNSGVENNRVNRLIAGLNEQLQEKSAQIVLLQEQLQQRELVIDHLNLEIMDLSFEMDSIRKANESTRQELDQTTDYYNRAWYTMGTRRELRNQNILTREGFLFFGSTRILKEDFDKSYFQQIDIREKDTIQLYTSKAEVLSNHPSGSFQLVTGEEGNLILVIEDPELFWSITRYLVIQVN